MSQRYTIARLTQEGERFEILVKPDNALAYRLGKTTSISNALVSDTIYLDANKGDKPSEEKLRKAFGTTDSFQIASVILQKGILQLTTEQRKQLVDDKRKQIIAFISRECVDPRTNLPHPPLRVERALQQIHYSIDAFKETEEQARDIIKLLRTILPLKMEQIQITINIPPQFASKAYGTVKRFGTIKNEEWRNDGSWYAIVEMTAGLYGPFLEKVGEVTRGSAEAKLAK
ncbi:ribosome assembly factor SBDS [Candidatus Bathyarchaeota archaeon]|nr:ribosome assembly factor SBDS [Candidatus Bathyarchaeota archaeon]NIV44289.1 ribosome assembly factor SBDS [Candidatus Bathyarchaeota archaeon]NIW10712.1 ribosome assembly factor SBDS [Gammaproteobacteria bacterium]